MTIDLVQFERSLSSLGDAREIMDVARRYVHAWPDLHAMAREEAAQCLFKHTKKRLNPDKIWWHRFDGANNSRRTFTGWEHHGKPAESIVFTDLVARRFDTGFQRAPDMLDLYSGFYWQGPGDIWYDERNEIAVLPSSVMSEFWEDDFATQAHLRAERFWGAHGDDFTLLSRIHLLAAADQALRAGELQESDHHQLRAYLGVDIRQRPSLAQLRAATCTNVMKARYFDPGNGAHLFTFLGEDDRVVLLITSGNLMLKGFANHNALLAWVHESLASPDARVSIRHWYRQSDAKAAQALLEGLRVRSGSAQLPRWPFGVGTAISDPFSTLAAVARQDMQASHAALLSNADLRKRLWHGYLGAFLQVFGGFAPAAWPIGLAVVGAGVAHLALSVEALVKAGTVEARRNALLAVIADSVAVVLGVVDVALAAGTVSYRPPAHELRTSLEGWQAIDVSSQAIPELETNPVLPDPVEHAGVLEGISVLADGGTWIELDGLPYRVRYSTELKTWLVVSGDNPFAFAPIRPVRLEAGRWCWLGAPGLAGGMPNGLEQVSSPFWDFYMRENLDLRYRASLAAAQRQRAVLDQSNIVQVSPQEAPLFDEHGYRYVMSGSVRHYSYREGGEYFNDLLLLYTDEMVQANKLFRHGVTTGFEAGDGDLRAFLRLLCDSLDRLPRSNAVTLWRGGNAYRGTSGLHLRNGTLGAGDVLVTTDIASFTENPFELREFVAPLQVTGPERVTHVFDESSVIYELAAQGYQDGIPASMFSLHGMEVETLFLPGRCFRIESISELNRPGYRFIWVKLRQVPKPASGPLYEMRTGVLFDRAAYAARVNDDALMERLFPAAQWSSPVVSGASGST